MARPPSTPEGRFVEALRKCDTSPVGALVGGRNALAAVAWHRQQVTVYEAWMEARRASGVPVGADLEALTAVHRAFCGEPDGEALVAAAALCMGAWVEMHA